MQLAIYSSITLLLLMVKNSGATSQSIKMGMQFNGTNGTTVQKFTQLDNVFALELAMLIGPKTINFAEPFTKYFSDVAAVDPDSSIYYDLGAKTKLAIEEVDASRIPLHPIKFISQGLPCSCVNWACGCCSGINITIINFNRVTCTNVTFVPEELAMDFYVSMDDDIVVENRLTARNPPPICVPVYFLPIVSFCVRFFDLQVTANKFKTCIDFETRISQWTIFILHFNCLSFGGDGIGWVKPTGTFVNAPEVGSNKTGIYNVLNVEEANGNPYYVYTSTSKLNNTSG